MFLYIFCCSPAIPFHVGHIQNDYVDNLEPGPEQHQVSTVNGAVAGVSWTAPANTANTSY